MSNFKGILLDLQGVLYHDCKALPGAVEAVAALNLRGIPMRFLTNTTTRPRQEIVDRMQRMGFAVEQEQVFTPALAAAHYLQDMGARRVHLAADPGLGLDLYEFQMVDTDPDAVIMGDLYKDFTWDRLDELFQMLRGGARLIALHKNHYSRRGSRISLDLGPFVAAMEYAASVEALVVGKPSKEFFDSAVADMGLKPAQVVMVGDDIEADIGGALAAGLKAVQVQTGKYTPADDDHPTITPTARLDSVGQLPEWV